MLQILIVVFREILEISLIIGILMAVTKDIKFRGRWIFAALFCGILGSIMLAFSTDKISDALDGAGQEVFNGVILLTASTMISWTVIWMQQHARTISGELKQLSESIKLGQKTLYSLFIVVFLSVLREGSEVVLFTYSSYISGVEFQKIVIGFALGLFFGIIFGAALYFGMIKAFGKYFFKITSWVLVFLACGISAKAVGFFVSADLVSPIIDQVWDSSHIISQKSVFGNFLHVFVGYIDNPSLLQIVVYLLNLTILFFGLRTCAVPVTKNLYRK